jgi:AcrR family transcriptional regulator
LRLEHVAARAGVGKNTIYRRWPSKEDLTLELLLELARPHLAIADVGDTRAELLAAVENPIRAITASPFGPVIRAMLSQIAGNPAIGDPFRAAVVAARRAEIGRVIERAWPVATCEPMPTRRSRRNSWPGRSTSGSSSVVRLTTISQCE